jgi:mannose-6-phosphate isomerase-like protein (cupin superfamily)
LQNRGHLHSGFRIFQVAVHFGGKERQDRAVTGGRPTKITDIFRQFVYYLLTADQKIQLLQFFSGFSTRLMTKPRIIHQSAASEYYFAERCHITEWWNSPCDEQASIACARVEPGVTTRLHRLRKVTERYVILEGMGRVDVGELPPTAVGPGDVVIIPPGTPQRITNTGSSDLIFLAICTPRFTRDSYQDIDSDAG